MGQSKERRGAVPHSMLGSGPEPILPVDEPVRLRGSQDGADRALTKPSSAEGGTGIVGSNLLLLG